MVLTTGRGLRETWGHLTVGIEGSIQAGGAFKGKIKAKNSRGSQYRDSRSGRYIRGPRTGNKGTPGGIYVGPTPDCPDAGCEGYVDVKLKAQVGADVGFGGEIVFHLYPPTKDRWDQYGGVQWGLAGAEVAIAVEGGISCFGPLDKTFEFVLGSHTSSQPGYTPWQPPPPPTWRPILIYPGPGRSVPLA